MAYDDAVLELSIEARSGVDAPYLEGSRFSSYRRIDVYGELIRGLNHLTGDRTCSRRILLGAITFLTVLGAFHFCHGLLDRTGLACVGAVLLALPRHSLGADFWGILDLEHVLPRSLYTPVFFPVLLGFIRHLDTPRGAWWILSPVVGLPLYSLSPAYLVLIFAVTYVLYHRGSRESMLCATRVMAALGGVVVVLLLLFTGRIAETFTLLHLSPSVGEDEYWAAIKGAYPWAFYPSGFPGWGWDRIERYLLLSGAAAGLALLAVGRKEAVRGFGGPEGRALWIFGAVCVGVSLVPPAAGEAFYRGFDLKATFVEFFRPFKFVPLVCVWVLLVSLKHLAAAPWNRGLRWGLGGGLVASSAFLGALESKALLERAPECRLIDRWSDSPNLRSEPARRDCFREMCDWARTRTDPTDRFLFNSSAFRLIARRPIAGSHMEVYIDAAGPGGEERLLDAYRRLQVYYEGSPGDLVKLGRALGCRYFVCKIETRGIASLEGCTRVFGNDWYQVFRIE